jgi:hypothetical protein|tara:strand:+ start:390 stop:635 length:246 start_codon:yes stop_codon:yes gene_type:complete
LELKKYKTGIEESVDSIIKKQKIIEQEQLKLNELFVSQTNKKIRSRGNAFLFTPGVLVVLSPIFMLTILIPKFTTILHSKN